MNNNITFILAILVHGIIQLGFVAGGIYALQNGFMKSGGWLIFGSILSLISTRIIKKDNYEDKDEDHDL